MFPEKKGVEGEVFFMVCLGYKFKNCLKLGKKMDLYSEAGGFGSYISVVFIIWGGVVLGRERKKVDFSSWNHFEERKGLLVAILLGWIILCS